MEIRTSKESDYEIMGYWEDIGIQLDIAEEKLAAIRRSHTTYTTGKGPHHDSDQAFRLMIRVWLKQVNPLPTWSNFVKALERLNMFQNLTDQLRSKYGTWQSNCCMGYSFCIFSWLIGSHKKFHPGIPLGPNPRRYEIYSQ